MRKFLQILYILLLFSVSQHAKNPFILPIDSGLKNRNDIDNKSYNTKENRDADISYSIEPFYDVNDVRLIVVVEFKGEKTGETTILLPNNSSAGKNFGIKYLKPLSTATTIEDTEVPENKIVKYPPNSIVKIYYQIENTQSGERDASNYYHATITNQYFHFFSDTFFIFPKWDSNNIYNFAITWNHLPSKWKLVNSYGINQKLQSINTALWKFRHAVFAGGDFQIVQRSINSKQIYFASRSTWSFSLEQLCDFSRDIITAENNFWNDNSNSFNLEIILPIKGNNVQIAEARSNVITLFLSSDKIFDYNIKHTIASEYFNNWISNGMLFAEPEQLIYWFKEGICNYYGRLILLRSRSISLNEYVTEYNNILKEYFTSSSRFDKNENTVKELWINFDLNRATVLRGDIIAHNLNAAIMKNTNGTKSLDDFIRDLYKRCRNESLVISNGSLSALIRFYAGDAALSEIMRTLNSGTLLKANTYALGPCFYPEIITKKKFWLFGEEYEIPFYKLKNENQQPDKTCLWWFGVE
jgi:predicted metalloprotease with PDZ domain